MELRDYARVLRKQWRLVALCVLLAVGAAAAFTVASHSRYRATVKFFVSTSAGDASSAYTGGLLAQQRVKSYADIVSGPTTADAVAKAQPSLRRSLLTGAISATAVPDTVLLETTVTAATPALALQIAQAVAKEFPPLAASLEQQDGTSSPVKVSVVEQPQLPTAPYSPKPARNLALALVLGLLLGVGAAVLRDSLDNTVKTAEDVLEASGAAVLGAIGYEASAAKRPLVIQDDPRSSRAEAFRQLRTNLSFIEVDRHLSSLVITSSVPQEGKSTMACNLAITLSQAGVRVCLLEGDLRRPRVADYLGLEGAVGVTNVLIGTAALDDALQTWGTNGLAVLPSGPIPPNPSELLSSRGMAELVEDLVGRFDLLIVDAPPLLPVTDAAILATLTEGAVLAVRAAATRKDQVRQAVGALQSVDAKVLGVVLNMIPKHGPNAYSYSYGYGYGAYQTDRSRPHLTVAESDLAVLPRPRVTGATTRERASDEVAAPVR